MAVSGLSEVTISIDRVNGFEFFSEKEAIGSIEEYVIPACEAKGIKLSHRGNQAGIGSTHTIEEYDKEKQEHTLFNIGKIQMIFISLDSIVVADDKRIISSSSLVHAVNNYLHTNITIGDLTIAMLLKGYTASFELKNERTVNCDFKARIKIEQQLF